VKIATGSPEEHPTPLPVDYGASPRVASPTAVASAPDGPTIGGRDTTGEYQSQRVAAAADVAAAQAAGMAAEHDRRTHYAADILPTGAAYGDAMVVPVVPTNAVPPAMSDLYPYAGLEPVPAAAGFDDPAYGT
jgi:hypothetical protein